MRTIPSRFVCRNEGRFQPEEPAGVRRNRARGRTGRRRATISHDSGRSQDANGGRHGASRLCKPAQLRQVQWLQRLTWSKHFAASPYSAGAIIWRVTTETGWDTASLSQDQQGKVLTNVYLSAAARGWSYTFIYQMIDDADTFGVFLNTNPLMPKMAATYIHNLTTILGDTNSNVSATPLSYSISDEPPRYTIGSCKEQRYLRACSMERSGYRRECYRNDCSAASYDGQCV